MKTTNWILGFLAAGLLALCACSKQVPPPEYAEIHGVKVELPKLEQAFSAGTPEQQASVAAVQSSVRYGKYEEGLMELDKLLNDPGTNEDQKKVVNALIEQMKQVFAKAGAGAAPAEPAQ
jgi:hypothetical protein